MTGIGDTKLRERVSELVEAVQPSPIPLDEIIRRGNLTRLRRAGVVAGGIVLAGIIAAAALLTPRSDSQEAIFPVTVPASGMAGPGGVFASGAAQGHPWRLAVQNIADPGYRCLPAITINGTDADPVSAGSGNSAAVTLGSANPGIGFAFVQLPAGVGGLVLNGRETIPAVTAIVCGQHYRLAGFAYPLKETLRLAMANPSPTLSHAFVVPVPVVSPAPSHTSLFTPPTAGMWNNVGLTGGETFSATLATGKASGQEWMIRLLFGVGGDCYEFSSPLSSISPEMGACGPVSTPEGAETIMALPLGRSKAEHGAIGYAVQVSPATAHLRATMSDGRTQLITPRVVDGRKYAAFVVASSLRLDRLTWLDTMGRDIASTTALPQYGYTQFQP